MLYTSNKVFFSDDRPPVHLETVVFILKLFCFCFRLGEISLPILLTMFIAFQIDELPFLGSILPPFPRHWDDKFMYQNYFLAFGHCILLLFQSWVFLNMIKI